MKTTKKNPEKTENMSEMKQKRNFQSIMVEDTVVSSIVALDGAQDDKTLFVGTIS